MRCIAFEVLTSSLYRPCAKTAYSGKVKKENVIYNNSITRKYVDLLSDSAAVCAQSEEFICVPFVVHERGSLYASTVSIVVRDTAVSAAKTKAATIITLHLRALCDRVASGC